jgi:hypothetical protein
MSQKRNMPSKKNIVLHWNNKYKVPFDDTYCWGCGLTGSVERAHLLAKSMGGSDDSDNLILICKPCHYETQEYFANTQEEADNFKLMILDGMPLFNIRKNHIIEKAKLGLYDLSYKKMGIDENDWLNFIKYANGI